MWLKYTTKWLTTWHDSLHLSYDSLPQSHISPHHFIICSIYLIIVDYDSTRLQSTQLLDISLHLYFYSLLQSQALLHQSYGHYPNRSFTPLDMICSIYIVIYSFNLRFHSINHMETFPKDPSWLDMTKKPIFGLTRLQSTWWYSLHLYCDSILLIWFAPFILWFTPLDMIRSIYIVIHSINLDKSILY